MIETKGYNGAAMWIDSTLVMSIVRKNDGMSMVCMACMNGSEEWILSEDVSTLLPKIEYAKDLKEAK